MDSSLYQGIQDVKGIKEVFNDATRNRIEEFSKLGYINFYSTMEESEIFTSNEGMTGYKQVGELETPDEMDLEVGYKVTLSELRYSGLFVVPSRIWKRAARDNTQRVNMFMEEQRNQAMATAVQKVITDAHLMLNEAFDSTSLYLAPDGVELCGSHTWNSGGTFDNSDTQAMDEDAVFTADEYAGAFTDPAGKENAKTWTDVVVKKGSLAAKEAIKLFAKEIAPTAVGDVNIYEGSRRVHEVKYITSANKTKWFMFDLTVNTTPLRVGVGQYPMMEDPIRKDNNSLTSVIEDFRKQGVVRMPQDVYGSDGTT